MIIKKKLLFNDFNIKVGHSWNHTEPPFFPAPAKHGGSGSTTLDFRYKNLDNYYYINIFVEPEAGNKLPRRTLSKERPDHEVAKCLNPVADKYVSYSLLNCSTKSGTVDCLSFFFLQYRVSVIWLVTIVESLHLPVRSLWSEIQQQKGQL